MRFINTKSLLSLGLFSLIGIGGLASDASAQGNSQWAHEKNRIRKQQKQQQRQVQRQVQRQNQRNYRVYRNGSYYQTDHRGAELLRQAVNAGYQQGYRQGQVDRQNRRSGGYYGSNVYRSGTYGYQSYVDRSQYQYYFQQGFQRGYQDGFNTRTQYGYNSGGSMNILGSILGAILNIREF